MLMVFLGLYGNAYAYGWLDDPCRYTRGRARMTPAIAAPVSLRTTTRTPAPTATIARMTLVVAGHAFLRTMTRIRALILTNVRMTPVAAERVSLRTMTRMVIAGVLRCIRRIQYPL